MIVEQPLQECHRLGEFLDGNGRRVLLVVVDCFAQALLHGAPVDHHLAHIGEDGAKVSFEGCRLFRRQAREMDMDEALAGCRAVGCGLCRDIEEFARKIALHRHDRVECQAHFMAAFGQQAYGRIDQKRHVVVDDVDGGDAIQSAFRIGDCDLRPARFALAEEIEPAACKLRQHLR